jgi:uncharacterized iron-regulated protein
VTGAVLRRRLPLARSTGWGISLALLTLITTPAQGGQIGADNLDRLPPAQIILLGEVHDNPVHHEGQARALAALRPQAVVWEMLTPEQAARMPVDLSDADAVALAVDWAASGWPDFALYHPLLLAAPGARHLGAGVPREAARRAFGTLLAQVFGDGAARFGLDDDLPEAEAAARLADLMASHCNALPADILPGMLAAQRLRDGELARVALAALEGGGGPVVVITGNGHARTDWGVPALIARAAPEVSVLSVGQLEGQPEAPPPFDLWLVTAAPAREDPCAAFR